MLSSFKDGEHSNPTMGVTPMHSGQKITDAGDKTFGHCKLVHACTRIDISLFTNFNKNSTNRGNILPTIGKTKSPAFLSTVAALFTLIKIDDQKSTSAGEYKHVLHGETNVHSVCIRRPVGARLPLISLRHRRHRSEHPGIRHHRTFRHWHKRLQIRPSLAAGREQKNLQKTSAA